MRFPEQALLLADLSPPSRAALSLARSLALRTPLRLQLAHLLPPWPPALVHALFPLAGMGDDAAQLEQELAEHAAQLLLRYLEVSDPDAELWSAPPIVRAGHIPAQISELIHALATDLLILGASDAEGAHPDMLGHTASHALRLSPCPVLLLRGFERTPTLRHILCALDLGSRAHEVVGQALALALLTGASLELCFVLPDPSAQDVHDLLQPTMRSEPKRAVERARDKINALFERTVSQLTIPYPMQARARELLRQRHIVLGDPAPALIARAAETGADLVAFGSRDPDKQQAHALGRTAWALSRGCPTHLLVVPLR
jgi:nucleotide-binding universal stress UspA family protein